MKNIIRRVLFRPYRKGMGPTFTLTLWDTYRRDEMGKSILGYRLTMREGRKVSTLFEGEDFSCSPLHSIDGDETVEGLMCFLTLRPGDTDTSYFKDYTREQFKYCFLHAEALSCEVERRFGREE